MLILPGYKCPRIIKRYDWIGDSQNEEQFSIDQSIGVPIIDVKRIGGFHSWKTNLKIECCR